MQRNGPYHTVYYITGLFLLMHLLRVQHKSNVLVIGATTILNIL